MELSILDSQGKDTGRKISLKDEVFGIEANEHAIYMEVKRYLASQRQGTHKSKERAEIARTTKKHHKQKGTGGARYGSLKGPLHRGGGTAFGPRPRDYSFKLNKKFRRLAKISALSAKAQANAIMVVEDLKFDAPKTKSFIQVLSALGLENKKSLFVLADKDKNVYLSSRNLQGANVVESSMLNTYQIMNANNLVLTEGSVRKIESVLSA
ncbi:MAG: 50S ribosomal protein L4 [Schleiferiaceae bacterium]|jgi:large subunit ribosomal protein L4|nr:50S ribosomal protein L4 [Schleiferiaceae bacterium]